MTNLVPELKQSANSGGAGRYGTLLSGALFLATIALFARAVGFSFINYDDPTYVSGNAVLLHGPLGQQLHWALTAIVSHNYHPVTLLTEVLIAQTLGTSSAAFHACNVAIHACNVVLLYWLVYTLTRRTGVSVAVAALWGWHPLRVESVAWVSELKDVLCAFFWLWGLIAYARFAKQRTALRYSLVMIATALACGSKPMAVTMPLTMLLIAYWPLQRINRRSIVTLAMALAPVVLICAGFACATLLAQGSTEASMAFIPLPMRLENAALSCAHYIVSEFAPINLAPFYPHPAILHRAVSLWWIPAAIGIFAICILTILFRKKLPCAFVGWWWFILTLIPVIGFVQVGEQARADRYTYIPAIGFTWLVVCIFDRLISPISQRWRQAIGKSVGVVFALAMVASTYVQLGYWKNTKTLFEHALRVTSNNALAMDSVAIEDINAGHLKQALALGSEAYRLRRGNAMAAATLGNIYDRMGQYDKAVAAYRVAESTQPDDAKLVNDLAADLMKGGHNTQAAAEYQHAIRLDPHFAGAHYNLGLLLAGKNQLPAAIKQWQFAIKDDPSMALPYANLARAMEIQGDVNAAITNYRMAIELSSKPDNSWLMSVAWLLAISPAATSSDIDTAVDYATRAVKHVGDSPKQRALAYDTLGAALARQGRYDDAVAAAQSALKAAPTARLAHLIQQRMNLYRMGRPYLR